MKNELLGKNKEYKNMKRERILHHNYEKFKMIIIPVHN